MLKAQIGNSVSPQERFSQLIINSTFAKKGSRRVLAGIAHEANWRTLKIGRDPLNLKCGEVAWQHYDAFDARLCREVE